MLRRQHCGSLLNQLVGNQANGLDERVAPLVFLQPFQSRAKFISRASLCIDQGSHMKQTRRELAILALTHLYHNCVPRLCQLLDIFVALPHHLLQDILAESTLCPCCCLSRMASPNISTSFVSLFHRHLIRMRKQYTANYCTEMYLHPNMSTTRQCCPFTMF